MHVFSWVYFLASASGGPCGSGPIMAKRNQQGREDVYTSVLSAVKALDLYAQFHTDCIKPFSIGNSPIDAFPALVPFQSYAHALRETQTNAALTFAEKCIRAKILRPPNCSVCQQQSRSIGIPSAVYQHYISDPVYRLQATVCNINRSNLKH